MSRKGDLLELIDGAPLGVTSLTGSVWTWTHRERARRAFTELTRSHGSSFAVGGTGGPVGLTRDQHVRVWLALPDRWRLECDDYVDVRDGRTRWAGSPTHVTEVDDDRTGVEDTQIGLLISPGRRLLGALRFGEPAEDTVAGRPCLKVAATLRNSKGARGFDPGAVLLGGTDHSLWIDGETGIVLRHVTLIDDEPCAVTEFTEVRINPPIADLEFEFVPPSGADVEQHVELLLRMAEQQGADLTGIDREDPRAVQAAIHDTMRPDRPIPEVRLEEQRAKHVPVGDPPDDEAAARSSIEHAFTHYDEVDETGTALVNVQRGEGLAGPLREAQHRVPVPVGGRAHIVVDDIVFLRSDEAVVWFSVEVDGNRFPMVNGREGRAVRVGDRWLIEHATLVDLLRFARVIVPPAG